MKVVLVEPGKAGRLAEIGEDLRSMQKIVGRPIQAIYPYEDAVALICNDEGKLMRDIVKICEPGGRILDPFAGAGTTILAAVREGYEAVGIEKSDVYYKLGADRVRFALSAEESDVQEGVQN